MNLADLELAFVDASSGANSFRDLETGEVVTVTDEIREELEEIYAEVFPDEGAGEAGPDVIKDALERRRLPEWMREAYRDMEAFIETIADARLRGRLWDAIEGRGAFRRFRAVLATRDYEQERWYAFRDARLRQRILEWLADEGIEPRLEDV